MNQLKTGALLNYVTIALNTIVGLVYTPYMLECLGQNEYGIYSLASSTIGYLTVLNFGFGNAIIRYTAKYRAEGKTKEQWEMNGMFIIVFSIIGIVAFIGGMGLYNNIERLFNQTMTNSDLNIARKMILLLSINLAFTFPLSVFSSIISAYQEFVFLRVVNISRIILSTITLVTILTIGYKATALVIVQTIFNLSCLLINAYYCLYKLKIKIKFSNFNIKLLKEISVYSSWIFIGTIMDQIYWGTGQFVLGTLHGSLTVAIFSVAILFQQMYMSFSTSIASMLLPKVTTMVTTGAKEEEISEFFIKTSRIQCIIMSIALSGFIVFGRDFIILWAGEEYSQAYVITVIFYISLFYPLIQNTGLAIIQARKQIKYWYITNLIISIISLGLQIFLAKKFQGIGIAVAIGIGIFIGQGVLMSIYLQKKQSIDIKRFINEISKMLIIPLVMTTIGIIIVREIDEMSIIKLVAIIIIYSISYAVASWKYTLNKSERSIISKPIKSIASKIN